MTEPAKPDQPLVKVLTVERTRSGWTIVRLDGETVWRRFTRDPAFTRFWVLWPSSGSPVRHTLPAYRGVQLGGAWRPVARGYGVGVQGGVEFALPPVGETWTYHRLPDPPKTRDVPFPRPGAWVRAGRVDQQPVF